MIPKFHEFFRPVLDVLKDGQPQGTKSIRSRTQGCFLLTEDELAQLLPSGKQTVVANRVNWACTYLNKAGLVSRSSRGHYQITDEGRKALESGDKIDLDYLKRYDSFKKFHEKNIDAPLTPDTSKQENSSPNEVLENAFQEINNSLADDLLEEVMKLPPERFERLVVDLLMKMGYGDGIGGAGSITSYSHDEGIDGIIKEDQLGFSSIYIQAKRWDPSQKIGRPVVQGFAGALLGKQAQRGLFITTADFTKDAREYAGTPQNGIRIVLINGAQLTRLMIKFDLGVSIERTYHIKRIDSDFFEE